jgi:hypothetical protein
LSAQSLALKKKKIHYKCLHNLIFSVRKSGLFLMELG